MRGQEPWGALQAHVDIAQSERGQTVGDTQPRECHRVSGFVALDGCKCKVQREHLKWRPSIEQREAGRDVLKALSGSQVEQLIGCEQDGEASSTSEPEVSPLGHRGGTGSD